MVDLAARSSMLWRLPAEDLEVVASISALVQADWSLGWRTGFLSSGRLLCNFLLLQGPICKMRIVLFISLIYPPLHKNKKF